MAPTTSRGQLHRREAGWEGSRTRNRDRRDTNRIRQATNWRAEQAIRPAVVNRKSWGDNRTAHGADVQQTLMSVIRTARQQHVSPIALLEDLLRQRIPAPSSMLRLPASAADPRGP